MIVVSTRYFRFGTQLLRVRQDGEATRAVEVAVAGHWEAAPAEIVDAYERGDPPVESVDEETALAQLKETGRKRFGRW